MCDPYLSIDHAARKKEKHVCVLMPNKLTVGLYCKVKLQGGSIPQTRTHTLTTI